MPRLKANLPPVSGYFMRTPNYLVDELLPRLKDTELRLLLVVIRATTGWNRDGEAVTLTYRALRQKTGRHTRAIAEAIRSLKKQGLIHVIDCSDVSKPKQGTTQISRETRTRQT